MADKDTQETLSARVQEHEPFSFSLDNTERGRTASAIIHVPSARSEERILGLKVRPSATQIIAESGAAETLDICEHTMSLPELAKRYRTSLNEAQPEKSLGMTTAAAHARLAEHGSNTLPAPRGVSPARQFLEALADPLNILLLVAAAVSLGMYAFDTSQYTPIYLGCLLVIVTLGNASIDFVQARACSRVLHAFKDLYSPQTYVMRDGFEQQIMASDIVPGDIVQLKSGDKIPADIRVVWSNGLKVDNSTLTGEGEALDRNGQACERSKPFLDAPCLAFFGTTVVEGVGGGVVIRTGTHTTMGKIAGIASDTQQKSSPLHEEIHQFVKLVAVISIVVGLVFFAGGMVIQPDLVVNFVNFVGVFVAFIPQGLPSTVSIMLTYAAKKLAGHNVLVKDLHAVDTLGTITLLASDKTGTMTQNRMTVVGAWTADFGSGRVDFEEAGDGSQGRTAFRDSKDPILLGATLCSTSSFERSPENLALPLAKRVTIGDATESGLLRFAADRVAVDEIRKQYPMVFSIPFNSRNKWHLTIHALPHADGDHTLFLKGALERVLDRCDSYQKAGVRNPVDDEFRGALQTVWTEYASSGKRVIAFAMIPLKRDAFPLGFEFSAKPNVNFPTEGLTFLGLLGIRDPPKAGVADAVKVCKNAGIRVMMITGDHAMTAHAIAKQVNIITGLTRQEVSRAAGVAVERVAEADYDAEVVTADKLDSFSEEEWSRVLSKREVVFARTSPEQKLEIVARCQLMGHVVGVTGDGVNDAPALKRADMGISMGISGSDASKEAAAMILLDDHFASIVHGIEEGRLIFTNLKKAIQFTLAHILPELVPFLLYVAVGIPLGLNSLLILVIDLGTDLVPALSFSVEVAESDIMETPPRKHITPAPVVALREEMPHLLGVESFSVQEVDLQDPANDRLRPRGFRRTHRFGFPRCRRSLPNTHVADEVLVDAPLMLWSYFQTGVVTTIACFCSYFLVFHLGGVDPSDLVGAAHDHFSTGFDADFETSDGTVFDKNEQEDILSEAQSAYFFTLVVCQMATAYVMKVRGGMPFGAKMFRNRITFGAMVTSVILALICIYVPGLNGVLLARPFAGEVYGVALGGAVAVIGVEVVSRWIRGGKHGGHVERSVGGNGAAHPPQPTTNGNGSTTASHSVA